MAEQELSLLVESEMVFQMLVAMAKMPRDQNELLKESGKNVGDPRFHSVKRTTYLTHEMAQKFPKHPAGVELSFENSHEADYQRRELDFYKESLTISRTNRTIPKSQWPKGVPGGNNGCHNIEKPQYDEDYAVWTKFLQKIAAKAELECHIDRPYITQIAHTTEWGTIEAWHSWNNSDVSREISLHFRSQDRDKVYKALRNYYQELIGDSVDERLLEALRPRGEQQDR